MPQAVAHFLIAALSAAIFRDFYLKKRNKKNFPLHYVLFAGIGGVLPDIDILAFWVLFFFGFTIDQIHRGFTHSLFFALIFLILGLAAKGIKIKELGKHKLKLDIIFYMIAFGIITHIFLDSLIISHNVRIFYPFSDFSFGLDLVLLLPQALQGLFAPTLDAALLIIWIIYLEWKHKISDFI